MLGLFTVHVSFVEIHPWKSRWMNPGLSKILRRNRKKQPQQLLRQISWLRVFIIIIIYIEKNYTHIYPEKKISLSFQGSRG